MFDYVDFYIKGQNEPKFTSDKMVEDDIIDVIIQKYKLVIFTNKGELLGDPNFGADLVLLLNETRVSEVYVENEIVEQINKYIPEINNMNYSINIVFTQDEVNYYDIMYIYFKIADYEVYAQFGKSIQ